MSEEAGESKEADTKRWLLAGCVIVGSLLLVAMVMLAVVIVPNFINMGFKAKRAEVPLNLRTIKTAQMQYESQWKQFVPAKPYPPTPTKTTQRWEGGNSGGFKVLDWQPGGEVRGSYWVEVHGEDFTAYGVSDLDGDGVYATYIATKSENPHLITTPNVY